MRSAHLQNGNENMSLSKATTFLILKYGSIPQAYSAWVRASYYESKQLFTDTDMDVLRDYEMAMQEEAGLGHNDPR